MKQHITSEQKNELSDKQRKILEDWTFDNIIRTQKSFIPLLSIGQMIEFLDEGVSRERLIIVSHFDSDHGMSYRIICYGKEHEREELCDALWEATKQQLDTLT